MLSLNFFHVAMLNMHSALDVRHLKQQFYAMVLLGMHNTV